MASQSLGVLLDVTPNGDGSFDVTMSANSAMVIPPLASVNSEQIHLGAATEEVEYVLEFSFSASSSGFQFDAVNPILWPYPPGTEFPLLYKFGHVTSTLSQCSLPVRVRHFAGQPSHGFLFFFNIVQLASGTNPQASPQIRIVTDPTIVTDPDPDV